MAVSVSAYGATLTNLIGQKVGLNNWKAELLNSSAAFNVAHTSKEQVDNGSKATVTMTIATPGVITWAAHGLAANTPVQFLTTGALPTGLTAGTWYYVVGASITTNTFQVSATSGGAAINTSGAQSGVITAWSQGSYEVNGNGWAVGGPAVAGVTVTQSTLGDSVDDDAVISATNVDVVASGGTIGPAYAALVYDANTNIPLFFINFGQAQSAGNTTDFKIVWNAGGIFTFTL